MSPPAMGTSRWHWLFRGLLAGFMILASLNAISLFVRSHGWGGVLGPNGNMPALGFPLEVWRLGGHYDGYLIDIQAMLVDVACGLLVGIVIGGVAISQMHWLNAVIAEIEQQSAEGSSRRFQFSIGAVMLATVPVALLFAAARTGRVEVLAAIYVFGPLMLIVLAMLPRGLSWDVRVVILTPMALSLIGFAVWIGYRLGVDFDKVLMGIFACWVPQSTIGAMVLTGALLIREYRAHHRQDLEPASGPR